MDFRLMNLSVLGHCSHPLSRGHVILEPGACSWVKIRYYDRIFTWSSMNSIRLSLIQPLSLFIAYSTLLITMSPHDSGVLVESVTPTSLIGIVQMLYPTHGRACDPVHKVAALSPVAVIQRLDLHGAIGVSSSAGQ